MEGILMIVDELRNAGLYAGTVPDFMGAVEYAMSLKDAECGRYEYGDHYVMILQGETRALEGVPLEAHRRYADLQIILSGAERVEYAPLSSLDIVQTYGDPILSFSARYYIPSADFSTY
jgi:beta-galactosidase beta subunit